MTKKTELQKKLEKQTGLAIARVSSAKQMEAYLDAGLSTLYRAIFAEPPWEEKIADAEARACFNAYLEGKGDIFVALDEGKPVAFAVTVPLEAAWEDVQKKAMRYVARAGIDPARTAYFAEDGVDPRYRRRGISSGMKALRLEACAKAGATTIILRTSRRDYAEINVVNKTGGTVIAGFFQRVAQAAGRRGQ